MTAAKTTARPARFGRSIRFDRRIFFIRSERGVATARVMAVELFAAFHPVVVVVVRNWPLTAT